MPDRAFLEFIYTDEFVDSVEGVLGAEQLRALEVRLLERPDQGRIVVGTGGVRKMRFALPGGGKSGGLRVLYVYAKADSRIYLLLAYAKSVRDALSRSEKNELRKWTEML